MILLRFIVSSEARLRAVYRGIVALLILAVVAMAATCRPPGSHSHDEDVGGDEVTQACRDVGSRFASVFTDATIPDEQWRPALADLLDPPLTEHLPSIDRSRIPAVGGVRSVQARSELDGCDVTVEFEQGTTLPVELTLIDGYGWRVTSWG